MSVWLRNRRTGYAFRTKRTLHQGRYLDEVLWLRDHGYVFFGDRSTPDGYIHETWVDREGNVVHFTVSRPSDVRMEDATIVDARYIPVERR